MIHGVIDLMNHSTFEMRELGKVREILWIAQELARIANSVVTWKRELNEFDCSSAIFAYVLGEGILTPDTWREHDLETILENTQYSNHHRFFLSLWLKRYHELLSYLKKAQLQSINLDSFISSMPRLFVDFHLNLEGHL